MVEEPVEKPMRQRAKPSERGPDARDCTRFPIAKALSITR
jgi:hypothetical protein